MVKEVKPKFNLDDKVWTTENKYGPIPNGPCGACEGAGTYEAKNGNTYTCALCIGTKTAEIWRNTSRVVGPFIVHRISIFIIPRSTEIYYDLGIEEVEETYVYATEEEAIEAAQKLESNEVE